MTFFKKYFVFYFVLTVFLTINVSVFSQKVEDVSFEEKVNEEQVKQLMYFPIDTTKNFREIIAYLVLKEINKIRKNERLDDFQTHKILNAAAMHNAIEMGIFEEAFIEESGKYKTTGDRVKFYGGSDKAVEIVFGVPFSKSGKPFDYSTFMSGFIEKLYKAKKELALIMDGNYIYTGIGVDVDEFYKKAYISIVLGNYASFNKGAEKKEELEVPYTKKKYGLKHFDAKACKKCDKLENMNELQKGLYVQDNKVYFKYNNLKEISKLFKESKDGLAVDLVQKAQFPCSPYNIYDLNLVNKGILIKPLWSKKILKKNLILDKKLNQLDVCLGKMPKKYTEPYELNLLFIQNKYVCRTITRQYFESIDAESSYKIKMQATINDKKIKKYMPIADETALTFKIPFERNKYDFNPSDIEPIIKSLNEPDFIIDGVFVYAYSSIEGDEKKNEILEKKRAESIVATLEEMQNQKIEGQNILTKSGWELFQKDVLGSDYEYMANLTKEEAVKEIASKNLYKDLEPIFTKQRFAQVVMDVTFNIKDEKEVIFVISRFNKALKKGDFEQALSIQKYIMNKIAEGKYDIGTLDKLDIPKEPKYADFAMNNILIKKQINKDDLDTTYYKEISKLSQGNKYVSFNTILAKLELFDFVDEKSAGDMQKDIDKLYGGKIDSALVDKLNLKYLFKIIEQFNNFDVPPLIVAESYNKIKSMVNVEESTWQSALKLAKLFIENKDYKYSAKLLEPHAISNKANEDLLFTYIITCSHVPELMKSKSFILALRKAKEINKERYCKLFGEPFMSFQVFENPFVKEDYCDSCK